VGSKLETPGPGAYNPQIQKKAQHFYKSTVKRGSELVRRDNNASLGPGTYHVRVLEKSGSKAFMCTEKRDPLSKSFGPGPAYYD